MTSDPVTRIEVYYAIEEAFAKPPVSSSDLLGAARRHGAREDILKVLDLIPEDQSFRAVRQVWEFFPDMPTGSVDEL
ncbi:DUF2795 domain-containing protein [Microbacterium paraoxydans]|uniref:DUF2795 domain-containing protein n=1 Tax=Microbacterium paraoxydans TaxID=199592 RepID=UPI003D762E88